MRDRWLREFSRAPWFPGLAVAALVTLVAELAARVSTDSAGQPRLPAVFLALALGAVLGNALFARSTLAPGLDVAKKRVLKAAIVLYGLGITAANLRSAGPGVFLLVLLCLVLALLLAAALGRLFGVSTKAQILLGCGTAICGATAVVTVAPLVEASDDEVGFAVTTIFLFNLVALFSFPFLGHVFGLSDNAFGAWVGTAVNDTSAVIATGRAFSVDAGAFATLVKVLRTLALVPLALALAALPVNTRRSDRAASVSVGAIFPWFVLGFAATTALAVTLRLPPELVKAAKTMAGVLVTLVLAAVGLGIDAKKIAGAGARSLALGFAIATAMAFFSLTLVKTLGIR